MIVKNYIAKLNDNNCRNIQQYMNQGLSTTESFIKEIKKNRHNPNLIQAIENRNDKWVWLFKLLEIEQNINKSIQSC